MIIEGRLPIPSMFRELDEEPAVVLVGMLEFPPIVEAPVVEALEKDVPVPRETCPC